MPDKSSDNKRIAKNTAFLYIRMLVMLFINLYTSRVVLEQLGVSDYGLYNVVGSLVLMFSFIQGSLASSASRFFSYEIGGGTESSLNKVFCMSMNVHIIFAIFIFIFAETAGLWYVYNKMVIPPARFSASLIVYQISTINAILTILLVPFSAMIISQERMKTFAYISIFESVAKLLTALYLAYTGFDKLVIYGLSLCLIQLSIQVLYMGYCKRHFLSVTRYRLLWDKAVFKEIFGFAGWSLVSYSGTVVNQATNLLLNSFFGPVVNAARAVSYQVQNNVTIFVTNFQIALNPQIVKNYAARDMQRVFDLVDMSTKISFSLLFVIMLPLLVNLDFVLNIWLKEVPQDTETFIILISIATVLSILQNPLNVCSEAANKLKKYNIINATFNLLQIPVCYVVLKMTHNVYLVFVVQIVWNSLAYFIRLYLINGICSLPMLKPLVIYTKIIVTLVISLGIGYVLLTYIENNVVGFLVKCTLATAFTLPWAYFCILESKDRKPVNEFIKKKLHRI